MANPIKLKAIVSDLIAHGEGVYTLKMKPEGRVPKYKPGQFLHLTVDGFDPSGGFWPESRVFSIASSYGENEIVIVYSVKGSYTKKMEEVLVKGKEVWLKFPYGDFIIDNFLTSDQTAILIAGGTGVSPYIPFIKEIQAANMNIPAVLYYGARKCDYVLFNDLINDTAKGSSNFNANIFIENENPNNLMSDNCKKEQGRLSIETIFSNTKDLKNPVYFLSGPPVMIKLFKTQLLDKGVSLDSIKIDEWE